MIAVICHCITSSACEEIEIECEDETCTKCYKTLATQLLKNSTNYIELQKKFFPSDDNDPDFIIVTYLFDGILKNISDSEYPLNQTWFWSASEYFFYHPLRVIQFTSLGFSDPSLKQTSMTLHLPVSCYAKNDEAYVYNMRLLTQRVSSL